jgi:hypothetical protein
MRAAVAHRRQLILALKPLRQRLHAQLNALAPGLSAPEGHGRQLALETPTGHAVLACAAAFAGRAASARSLQARQRAPDRSDRPILGEPLEAVSGAASGCPTARGQTHARRRSPRRPARGHRVRRRSARGPARQQRGPGPHHPARRRDRQSRRVHRAHPACRAIPDTRTPLLSHWPGTRQLPIGNHPKARRDLPHRPTRTPRRLDGHRVGPRPVRSRLPAAPGRAQRPRQDRHPGTSRARPPRLPTVLANPSHPTALRRSALRSRQARPRTVTAFCAMPHDGAT